jgi:hypothetical protein
MRLQVSHPASIFDMAELGGAISRTQWAVVREMHENGDTWAMRYGDELVLVLGLYPIDEVTAEAWFQFGPGASRHMVEIIRRIKLTIGSTGYRVIVTVCHSEAGKRIARAVGLTFHAPSAIGEIWKWVKFSAAEATPETSSASRKRNSAASSPI